MKLPFVSRKRFEELERKLREAENTGAEWAQAYSDAVIRHSHEIEELTEKLGPAIEILKQGGGYQVRIIPVLPDVRFVERGRDPDEMPAAKFSRIEYGRYRVVMDISEAVLDGASKDRTAARLILGALWDRFVQELAGQLERMRASRRSL